MGPTHTREPRRPLATLHQLLVPKDIHENALFGKLLVKALPSPFGQAAAGSQLFVGDAHVGRHKGVRQRFPA